MPSFFRRPRTSSWTRCRSDRPAAGRKSPAACRCAGNHGPGPGNRALLICLLGLDDLLEVVEEPGVDLAQFVDPARWPSPASGPRRYGRSVWNSAPAGHVRGLRWSRWSSRSLPSPPKPKRPVSSERMPFLEGLLEGPADGHGLAHRFHRRGQDVVGLGKFLEGPARDLDHAVVDGRLKRGVGLAGDIVFDLVEGVADRQLGGDLGDRESRWPSRPGPSCARPAGSSR